MIAILFEEIIFMLYIQYVILNMLIKKDKTTMKIFTNSNEAANIIVNIFIISSNGSCMEITVLSLPPYMEKGKVQ